jgi:hypothetical protein
VHSALDGSGAAAAQLISGWTGTGSGITLASDQLLAAHSKDTYTIVVAATVTSSLAAGAAACSTAGSGSGFFNTASLTSGSDQFRAQACDPITPLPNAPTQPAPPAPPAPITNNPVPVTG